MSKYQIGEDGKTAYERLKGKPFSRAAVEFGEKIHYRKSTKGPKENKLDSKWDEGFFMGFNWRTGEAIVGTKDGATKASTIRRVGAHRRWDAEGLDAVRGVPWQWDPESDEETHKLLVRHLTDEEKAALSIPTPVEGPRNVYRMRLKRDDFIEKGFTDGCPGCKAILSGGPVRGHTEQCRKRMEGLMQQTTEGQERIKRQVDKENEYITQRLAASDEAAKKKQKCDPGLAPEGGTVQSAQPSGPKPGGTQRRPNEKQRTRGPPVVKAIGLKPLGKTRRPRE